MWLVMMMAMMLPSLVPMLSRYRHAVGGTGETRLGRLTALVGVGYFFVWAVFGMAAFPLGVALAQVEMQHPALARAVPLAVGVVVLDAGARRPPWHNRAGAEPVGANTMEDVRDVADELEAVLRQSVPALEAISEE